MNSTENMLRLDFYIRMFQNFINKMLPSRAGTGTSLRLRSIADHFVHNFKHAMWNIHGWAVKRRELPQNSGLIKNTDLWTFRWFQSWHLMRRSRLQAICNMTWGARYSAAPRPTNERAGVSGYQPARTDPPYRPSSVLAQTVCWLQPGCGKYVAVFELWKGNNDLVAFSFTS